MTPTHDAFQILVAIVLSGLTTVIAAAAARRARAAWRRRTSLAIMAVTAPLFAVLVWARFVEPRWIELTRVEATWPGPPLRVVVMGDFHAGRTGAEVVASAVRLANEADPDVVLLAGDYVTGYDLSAPKARILDALRPLRARRGVFAVLGNHDSEPYAVPTPRADDITRHLTSMGFFVLRNRWVEIVPGVTLIGLDEVRSRNIDAAKAFRDAPEGARLVLTHDWHGLREPGMGRFDVAVTGHTHGGQICLPFTHVCPFARESLPYLAGLYAWPEGGELFVTRGIGESAVLLRLGCRPEVAVIDLRASIGPDGRHLHAPGGR
jgi:predicted MPP superfamily phosphohydrolase